MDEYSTGWFFGHCRALSSVGASGNRRGAATPIPALAAIVVGSSDVAGRRGRRWECGGLASTARVQASVSSSYCRRCNILRENSCNRPVIYKNPKTQKIVSGRALCAGRKRGRCPALGQNSIHNTQFVGEGKRRVPCCTQSFSPVKRSPALSGC
jgi:hypothetical protein